MQDQHVTRFPKRDLVARLTHGLKYSSSRSIVPSDIESLEAALRPSMVGWFSAGFFKAATASLKRNVAGPPWNLNEYVSIRERRIKAISICRFTSYDLYYPEPNALRVSPAMLLAVVLRSPAA